MIPWYRFLILSGLFLAVAAYGTFHREHPSPLARPLSQFPRNIEDWRAVDEVYFNPALLDALRPTDYLFRRYKRSNGDAVDLYISYHDAGQDAGPIHSPKNCLPGSGWLEVYSRPLELNLAETPTTITLARYDKGENQELFLYWFSVRDWILPSEIRLKIAEVINSVWFDQRNAGFVRISIVVQNTPDAALAAATEFVSQSHAIIGDFLRP